MIRPLVSSLFLLAASMPASATEWIDCVSLDFNQRVQVLAGGVDFHQFSAATLYISGKEWSTSPEAQPGEPLDISQSFWDGETLLVDLIEPETQTLLAQMRVFTLAEGIDDAKGGVLRAPGRGAWVVTCDGP